MVNSPYPISGVVYDTDNSSVAASINMIAYNQRTAESITATTNALGEYVLDLANLTSGYDSGDVIFVSAYSDYRSIDYRTTTSAGDDVGGSESKNLYLMWGNSHAYFNTRLISGVVTNTAASQGNVKFYDRAHDYELFEMRVPANDTRTFNFVKPLCGVLSGLCRVPSANTMKATIQADI